MARTAGTLLYQAYARHDPAIVLGSHASDGSPALEAGADPNDGRSDALPTPFTVLTGVLGYGEQRQPWHPHASAFARLLLDAGADPNDGQALYNRMFSTNDDHLVLLFDYGLGQDTHGPWHRLLGESLESPTEMRPILLAWAITHDQRHRVALLAEHGVDVVSRSPRTVRPSGTRRSSWRCSTATVSSPTSSATSAPAPAASAYRRLRRRSPRRRHRGRTPDARRGRRRGTTPAHRPGDLGRGRGAPGAGELLVAAGFDVDALGRSDVSATSLAHGTPRRCREGRLDSPGACWSSALIRRYRHARISPRPRLGAPFDKPSIVDLLEP